MTDLSGIVSGLQQSYAYLTQQLLLRPDLSSFANYRISWNSQMQQLSDSVSRLQNQISTLQNLIFNLTYSTNSNYADFTGYTGSFSIGADDLDLVRRSATIKSPQESDEIFLIKFDTNYTLDNIYSVIDSETGTSVFWNIYVDTFRTGVGTAICPGIPTSDNRTGQQISSFTTSTFTSGDILWATVTGVNGTVNELSFTLTLIK